MSPRHRLLALGTAALFCAAGVANAAPWQTDTVLTAVDAGYGTYERVGFGYKVAMSADWLAVVASAGYCTGPTGGPVYGTVLMYRYDKATGQYTYTQQICSAWYGGAIAIWNDWLVLGSPSSNRVNFLRMNTATQQWNVSQSFDGSSGGQLGRAIAIEGGVAAAGESAYNQNRGRVRTWRLDVTGNTWISEGWIEGVTPGSHGATPDERFGSGVALDIRNCRAGSCVDPLDALAVTSRSRVWTIERLATGWGAWSGVAPAPGTSDFPGDIDLNESLAVTTATILADAPGKPCATDVVISEARVLQRIARSIDLRDAGFACRSQLGIGPFTQWVSDVAVQIKGREFFSSIEDLPAARLGVAATWEATSNWAAIVPTDFLVDGDRTSAIFAETGDSNYHPSLTGDAFGRSIAVQARRLAVGAPFYNGFTGVKSGYVALYKR